VSKQNLIIIYKFKSLYNILEELSLDLNYNVVFASDVDALNSKVANLKSYLIISSKIYLNISNQIILNNTPINILKLVEKINTEFLKIQFYNQSELKISNYILDLNSRELIWKNIKIRLTEKETNTIIYLSKSQRPVTVGELQKKVWSYKSDIETHTVETHIYRLRKKILKAFNDDQFIISENNGYQINLNKTKT
jgi:DNA-binding winged helix-turn-helix (wHTH) protein